MKLALFLLALTVGSSLALSRENVLMQQWGAYKKAHDKVYKDSAEDLVRFTIWKSNLNYVKKHNQEADNGKHTFWLKMNQFADMTNKEFVALYNGYNATTKTRPSENVFSYNPSLKVPESIDWRTQGYVTEVKNQEQCGSCWAFSATGSLEGQHFKATGKLVSLSEQNLVDCSFKYGNKGCFGGLMDQAFTYIKENNGIDTEESYPYKGHDSKCKFNATNVGATDTGFSDIESKNEKALQQAVATVGPISVGIDASHISFQLYSHGVYHYFLCSETRLDHGVLVVGYGVQDDKDFWIVKNSWAAKWGDKGYILMSRNRNNNCGIATSASYPLV